MRAYRVTTPNEGTRYTKSIDGVLELLDNDGYEWRACGPFHHFTESTETGVNMYSEDTKSHVKYSPSILRHVLESIEGILYQHNDSQYYPESEIIEWAYITIEVIDI